MPKKRVYDFTAIEQKWQAFWKKNNTFQASSDLSKPKCYTLTMFPYPSGQGLHTGHALGYVASDIVARYKRAQGYNVLHPMGFDSFGLPAEQYAQEVGQHPKITTARNTKRYREQLESLGLSFDWQRAVTTSHPDYYRWTQWLFLSLFETWYDNQTQRARPIDDLITILEKKGNTTIQAACSKETPSLTAQAWRAMNQSEKENFLLYYRLAYLSDSVVNWCPGLGTVLANDEVKDGLSERGGYPVEKKKMRQWSLRITAYADRLLNGLDNLDWRESIKEIQRNWIGRSEGVNVQFKLSTQEKEAPITTFTTRAETLFGVTYLVLAPEHPLIKKMIQGLAVRGLHTESQALAAYQNTALNLSERQRAQKAQEINGIFTSYYAIHPLTEKEIPIWVADYVLGSYGTGAVMGVPAHDERDHCFATHFNIPIINVIQPDEDTMIHSDFLNGMRIKKARKHITQILFNKGIGQPKVQYRLRDAVFSRQRYWGEPFPIYYKDSTPYPMNPSQLPLTLPEIKAYKPTTKGDPPLARAQGWHTAEGHPIECNTMPAWAGSSWYFFRYMDPHNEKEFVSQKAADYWKAVDLYIGGAEHATGHLLYARFFTQVLYDRGYVPIQEPFQKMINQGMIQATSHFVYRIQGSNQFVTHGKKEDYQTTALRVDHTLVKNKVLNLEAFKKWRKDFENATFILENNEYICGQEIEKMSKSKHNAINIDEVIATYGADSFRLYIMFIGPITQSKPWNTQGIEGIVRFIQRVYQLFHNPAGDFEVPNGPPSPAAERAVHLAIKNIKESIQRYTFNTAVSSLMICLNTLREVGGYDKTLLTYYLQLLGLFAPHLAEEFWEKLGHKQSILHAPLPDYDPSKIIEKSLTYPIAINGKIRSTIELSLDSNEETIRKKVLSHPGLAKWLQGKKIKRFIVIPKKMINFVLH